MRKQLTWTWFDSLNTFSGARCFIVVLGPFAAGGHDAIRSSNTTVFSVDSVCALRVLLLA